MKIVISYFSGTGNTKAVAEGYASYLLKKGHLVEIFSIEKAASLPEHDLLIIGGPIYAGNMPDELINWVRKNIDKADQKKAIVFSTSAGLANANGVKSISKKLVKKGYALIDMQTFEMPRNFYIDKYKPTPESTQKEQFEEASKKIIASVNRIDGTEKTEVNQSVLMIDLPADLFRVMAKSMGKSYRIENNCIGCGLCESNCPKQNIDHSAKKYHNKCIMCTRCIHNCPVNAISYKGKQIDQYRVHHSINFIHTYSESL